MVAGHQREEYRGDRAGKNRSMAARRWNESAAPTPPGRIEMLENHLLTKGRPIACILDNLAEYLKWTGITGAD